MAKNTVGLCRFIWLYIKKHIRTALTVMNLAGCENRSICLKKKTEL